MIAALVTPVPAGSTASYGLEWPGDGSVQRMLYWHNPFPIYDATYIFKVYPRKKTSGTARYYTTFFWGNDGAFSWDGGFPNTYYGAHPYPRPAPTGPGQWEISVESRDFTTGFEVEWDRWHTQAFRAWRESPTRTHHEFYYDLPDTSKMIDHIVDDPRWATTNPPVPAIVIGQAPNLNGQSWGGYPGWEEFNGIIRGIQIYSGLLSLSDIQSEIAVPKSTVNGQNFMWYLNLNPRPSDVTDKKGFGTAHNPSWSGTTAIEWSDQTVPPPPPPDTTPPTISGVAASNVTTTGARINWTTNEAADSQVEYGLSSSYGTQTTLATTPVTSHSQALSSLVPGTTYNYRVKSRDAAGNLAVSTNFTFTTQAAPTGGRTIEIFPGTDVFGPAAQGLLSGDTLVVHQGTYNETNRMSIQVRGTATAAIVIQGAAGESKPIITRPATASLQNTINIEGSATYLTIRGLEITGNGGDGIAISGAVSFITLTDNVVHDVDVAVKLKQSMDNITVKRNHIYNTGRNGGTGEAIYIGCSDAACVVRNSVFEQNWIHDVLSGATQGDGIEVNAGSHSDVIRDNVIYNRPHPGIFVYGTGSNPVNIVEGNVVWSAQEGIYAVSDAIVRNNIVFNSGTGLSLYGNAQVSQMKNVTAVNNTLYNNNAGIYMRWTSSALNMVLANNAVYSPGKTALDTSGSVGSFAANYLEGGADLAPDGTMFVNGGTAASAFVDPANSNFWPHAGSPLLNMANAGYASSLDFNQNARVSPYDVGAYEANGSASNPGWAVTAGFKGASPPPSPLPAIPGLIAYWPFDEGTGAVTADISGSNFKGTFSNNPMWVPGVIGSAVRFNATDNANDNDDPRIIVGRNFNVAGVPYTVTAWVNPTDFADWRAILSKRDRYAASMMRFDLGLARGTGRVYTNSSRSYLMFSYAPPANTWTHLAIVASSSGTQLYVNGVLVQTMAVMNLGDSATANTVIGGTGEGSGGDNDPFKGMLDEIRVYNRALSASEVQLVFQKR